MSESSSFDFNAFIQESKETLLNPKTYFPSMKLSGGMAEPIIKAVVYGAIAGIFAFLWSVLGLGGALGAFGAGIGAMAFVWAVVGALIGLFIGAVILLIISSICKGNTDFEANLRVVAALMVMMPINGLLGFAVGLSSILGTIISVGIGLYSLYLLYHALTGALKANEGTSKIVMYVLAGLLVIFTLAGMGARNRMSKIMKDVNMENYEDVLKDSN